MVFFLFVCQKKLQDIKATKGHESKDPKLAKLEGILESVSFGTGAFFQPLEIFWTRQ